MSATAVQRVLLVQGYLDRPHLFFTFPIGLATIAAYLPPEVEVRGLDPNAHQAPMTALRQALEEFRPQLVGVSLRNLDTTNYFDPHVFYNGFIRTVRTVREVLPEVRLAAGGPGFSLAPQRIMADLPELDYGVYLEGEQTFPELLQNLDSPERVAGLYYRRDGAVHYTGPRPLLGLPDDAPFPAWEIFDLEPYRRMQLPMGVETKRGCGYRCVYCCYYLINGQHYRLKSPRRVIEELKALRALGFDGATFTDSVFNTPREHALEILRLMAAELPGFRWDAYLSPLGLTEEFVRLSLQTGLRVFVFSPDTLGDAALESMGKRMSMADLEQAVELIRRNPPAELGLNLFINGPDYSYRTLWDMLRFLLRTKLRLGRRFALLPLLKAGYIRIVPGTPLEDMARKEGKIGPELDLLPRTPEGLQATFYFNRELRLLNAVYTTCIGGLRRLRHRILKKHGPRQAD